MKKNIISGVLAVVIALSFVACKDYGGTKENGTTQVEITTTAEAVTVAAIVTSAETTETTTEATTEQTTTAKVTTTAETTTKRAKTEATTTTAVTTTTAKTTATTANWGKKIVSTYGYSIIVPNSWYNSNLPGFPDGHMDSKGNNVLFTTCPYDALFENMEEQDFKDIYRMINESIKFLGYKKLEISGYKGYRVDVSYNNSAINKIVQTQVYIIVEDIIYLYTFTDMDGSNQDVMQKIIDSISIS